MPRVYTNSKNHPKPPKSSKKDQVKITNLPKAQGKSAAGGSSFSVIVDFIALDGDAPLPVRAHCASQASFWSRTKVGQQVGSWGGLVGWCRGCGVVVVYSVFL